MYKPSGDSARLRNHLPKRARTLNSGALLLCAVFWLAGCGGGSSAPPPPPPALPSISSFSPTSGAAGTSVTVMGSNLLGTTALSFNGTAATFQVVSASQITTSVPAGATSGKISVTTSNGTATSAGSFSVTPTAPVISGFTPFSGGAGATVSVTGTGFTGATSTKFNGTTASFTVVDDSHISATVPTGASSGPISVTTSAGTASSASSFTVNATNGLDLTIDGFYVTQTTQNYPLHGVPLLQGRSTWVRVFVLANQSNTVQPQVQVQFINGTTTNMLTINAPGTSVPTVVNVGDAAASWNAAVPAAWIQPGMQITAIVDPTNQIAEANKGNNQFSESPAVQTVHQWKITLVPVKTGDGRIGVIENSTRTRFTLVDVARGLWPVPDTVDVILGTQMNSSVQSLQNDGTGWDTVLNELQAKRAADGVIDRYYFGFVNVSYTSGVAGIGYIGAPEALGWDYPGAEWVLAHEEGHNFGRQHSPCGGASRPDPNYPYPGGIIGVPGWDVFAASNNLMPSTDTDIMGYCRNQWISDYVYNSALSFRAASAFDIVPAAAVSSAPKEGLLVWGRVEGGRITLEPAFRVPSSRAAVKSGEYAWEGRDAQGRVLAHVPFQAVEVEDVPYRTIANFAFVAPLDAAVLDALASVHVLKDGNELAVRRAVPDVQMRSALNLLRVQDLPGRAAQVDWDPITQPMVMLRDARTGEVRGFLRGGSVQIGDAPDELEVQVSDGVRSSVVRHTRTPAP